MDSQLDKPLTTASPLDKGTREPLVKKEPLNKPSTTFQSDTLLAGQSSAAGGISNLPSTGYVTYTESKLQPIITIKEVPVAEPIISTSSSLLPGQQRLRSESPLLDLERGEKSPKIETGAMTYERRLDTHLDQRLEGPPLKRDAGAELIENSGETKRLGPIEPSPYPTTVGTGTVGMIPGAEVPANLGATPVTTGTSSSVYPTSHSTGVTEIDQRARSPSKTHVTEEVKVSKHKHHEKVHKHHHEKLSHEEKKLSHEEKKNLSSEEKYLMHEREADRADAEGKGVKAAIEDLKAGYYKTEADTEVKETKHHKHKHGHKKDKL